MAEDSSLHRRNSDSASDPSALTTAALLREVTNLKELVFSRLEDMGQTVVAAHEDLVRVPTDVDKQVGNLKELVFNRLEDMDRAVRLVHENVARIPAERASELEALRQLLLQTQSVLDTKFTERFETVSERFDSVATQFTERDTRGERESRDNKVAVDAAFAAQKEAAAKQDEANQKAIDKSEKATGETLNKQADLFKSTTDALGAQIADMKAWQARNEGMGVGNRDTAASHRADSGLDLTRIGLLISLVGLVVLLIRDFGHP